MRALRSKQHRPVFTPEERAQWVSRFRSRAERAGPGSPVGPSLFVRESQSQPAQGASLRRERAVGLCETSREGHLRVAAGGRSQPLFTTGRAQSVAAWAGSHAAAQLVPKIVGFLPAHFFHLPFDIFYWTPVFSFAILGSCAKPSRPSWCKVERCAHPTSRRLANWS